LQPGPCAGGVGSCVCSWFFEAFDAVDCRAVHVELEPSDPGALGQLEQVGEVGFQRRVVAGYADIDELSSVNQDENSASIKMRISARAGGWRA
jgi:hypothetical protein